ncbi:hypothetical protein CDL15_Pgr026939 [Punica granatum]|uniref:F-box associated domain-containing protein n=1 Tax=Punica granatum TaxID=22663 RepID=A0A218XZE7_PUNGR|nr:hypothetical protein CDL15_Pgr026939 [Punica granatum]
MLYALVETHATGGDGEQTELPSLLDEIWCEILARFPVQDLLRLKATDTILLLVCNLVTRSYKLLPYWRYNVEGVVEDCHWRMVPSCSAGRYKIIGLRATARKIDFHICDFGLHTQEGNQATWKELHFPPTSDLPFVQNTQASTYDNGKLHWLNPVQYNPEETRSDSCALSLDIATEKFNVAACFPELYTDSWSWFQYPFASNEMFYRRMIHTLSPWSHMQPVAILDGDNKLVMRVPWTSETQMFVIDKQSGDWKEIAVDFKEFAPLGADEWAERDQYYIHHNRVMVQILTRLKRNVLPYVWPPSIPFPLQSVIPNNTMEVLGSERL